MIEQATAPRRGDELIARTATIDAVVSAVVIGVLIAASWAVSYALGGSQTVGPQLFHIPVVLAAARFGRIGSVGTALLAGVVCGPLLPLDVGEGEAQSLANWTSRLVIFVAVGHMVAALHSRSVVTAGQRIHDHECASHIRGAVRSGEIVPAFQPIVDLRTGAIVGVEALARWRSADGQVVEPYAFIDDAERVGVVHEIDRCILRQAAAQVVEWQSLGVVPPEFRLSVNLSSHHLAQPDVVEAMRALVESSGLRPGCLVFEITETGLVADPEGTAERLADLRGLGVAIALDDFGVGTSSLGNLRRFPIDAFKIDRSFILGAGVSERGRALTGSVIALAASLGLTDPVAEGIETEEQLRTLVALGCTKGQGYLFSPPIFAEDAEAVLQTGRYRLPRP